MSSDSSESSTAASNRDFMAFATRKPSVILLRRGPKRPLVQLRLLLGAMPVMEERLSKGSIILVEEKRIRVRRLPLGS